jgi:BirA family biotin operon repressor/biotin-[acetyl-CoA-carboxylase] ligase
MIKKIIRFKEVSSTQDTAKRFLHKHEEVAIASLSQKRGRGRHGRVWFSPLGGLYISLVLFPHKRLTSIPLLASLSIIRALEDFGFSRLTVRWPNDVLLNDKKVCGIICEQVKKAVICGMGLNVNVENFSRNVDNATSLKLETGKDFEIDALLQKIIGRFNPLYRELQQDGLKIREVLNYIAGIGESAQVITAHKTITGTVYDVDDDWALLLRDNAGIIRKLYYGDVKRLVW